MKSKFFDAIELTRDLIKINSENSTTTERKMQDFLVGILDEMGFGYEFIEYKTDRNNIVALFPPLEKSNNFFSRYVAFSGHMDTVFGYDETNSAEAIITSVDNNKNNETYGKIWGRGACDMKGPIASFLTAIKVFIQDYNLDKIQNSMKRGICIIFTVDEERGCLGVRSLKEYDKLGTKFNLDFCINAEPTELSPVIGHKGSIGFNIRFKGKAAHASIPEKGDNAIEKAARFITGLDKLKNELSKRKVENEPLITPPTLNVGIIKGGDKSNIVPDWCNIEIDRRLIQGETDESALKEIKDCANELGFKKEELEIQPTPSGKSYMIQGGTGNPLYKEILEITKEFSQNTQPFIEYYTEADIYSRFFGIPVIILGPGSINQAHKKDEFVEIDQLLNGAEIYYKILEKYIFLTY